MFKASLLAVYYCIESCEKLSDEKKTHVANLLERISTQLMETLKGNEIESDRSHSSVNELFVFMKSNSDTIPTRISLKIVRFLEDVHESIEASTSIKTHGTPVSLRAYCLVFIFVFPLVFVPVIVFNMSGIAEWIIYSLGMIHGFILISLYNVQSDMEDPFDQIGLDDIKLDAFKFKTIGNTTVSPDSTNTV
jgi:hypothetical protein